MKKLLILSGVALMVSSSLAMAADGKGKRDFESFDVNADGAITLAEAGAKMSKNFDKIDTDGNGSITKAEFDLMKQIRKINKQPKFADLDTNSDGSITADEFDAMKNMHQSKGHKKGNNKLSFAKADTNSDGNITKDEAKGRLLKRFDKIDSDANGVISSTEYAAMESMHKGKGNHKLDFATIDANNDGVITKDEAKGRLLKRFDKIDSDANGSITTAEFDAMKNMHKGKSNKKGKGNYKQTFTQLDVNNDAVITKDEAKGRLLNNFDKVDTDANGSITSAEFELIKSIKKGTQNQKLTFSVMDVNSDAAITKDEAKGRLLKNFDKIDSDANGKVTEQELATVRAAHQANKRPTFEMLDTDANGKISNAEFDTFSKMNEAVKKQIK